jgi:Rhs element Vgr protein
MAKSPNEIQDPTLLVNLFVGGSPLQDLPIDKIEIVHEVNKISSAEITIIYKPKDGTGEDPTQDNPFASGTALEVFAGYGHQASDTASIFKGVMVREKIEHKPDGTFQQNITCKQGAVEMTNDTTAKDFYNQTDSDILTALISQCKNPLLASVDSTTTSLPYLPKQEGTSDWDFLLARAEFNGLMVTMNGNNVTVAKPDLTKSPVLTIAMGVSIISFHVETHTEKQPTTATAQAWDVKNQVLLSVDAVAPSLTGPLKTAIDASASMQTEALILKSNTALTKDELQSWANGRLLRVRLSALRGSVGFIGNADVQPGNMIELSGVTTAYNGNIFVSQVKHSIDQGNWLTTVQLGLEDNSVTDKKKFAPAPAGGQIPPIQGLQVGTVKKIYEDPDSEYRILVTLPSKAQTQEGVWARVSNFYATSGVGAVFLPEIGDEVVLGFLETDPRFPIVLGSLYSSTKAPPQTASDNNNYIKSLVTKSKLKVNFDDQNTILTFSTPGGSSITLSDQDGSITVKDKNGNTATFSSSGIVLDSKSDIQLKATGNIELNATGKVSITATQDVAVSGMNVNHTANVGFSAKGNATAELSASAQTTVKGGIVMIN